MTAPTPEQAAAHAFVTGCVARGITASQAAVPPEGQLATVRGLWADVAQAAIKAALPENVKKALDEYAPEPAPELAAARTALAVVVREVVSRACTSARQPCAVCERDLNTLMTLADNYAQASDGKLREQFAAMATDMHEQAQRIAPASSEPDRMADMADQVRAEVLHECASRIRVALGPDATRELS